MGNAAARLVPIATVAALTAATVATVASLVAGHAASVNPSPQSLANGSAIVGRCSSTGAGVVQNLSGSNVVSVTVSQIAAGCGGGGISVTVNNGTANSSGSSTVPAGGGSVTLTLASAIAAKDAEQVDISVTGP